MKRLWNWLTSYPMNFSGFAFIDVVSGRSVNYYFDRHGKAWLAEHSLAMFRVERFR